MHSQCLKLYVYIYIGYRPRCLWSPGCVGVCVCVCVCALLSGDCPAVPLTTIEIPLLNTHVRTDYLVRREHKPSMARQYTCKRLPRRDGWCYTDLRADRRRSLTFECKNFSLWRAWNASFFGRGLAFREWTRTNPKHEQSADLYAVWIVQSDHDRCFGCSIRNIQRSSLSLILFPAISQVVLSNKGPKKYFKKQERNIQQFVSMCVGLKTDSFTFKHGNCLTFCEVSFFAVLLRIS